MYIYSGWSAAQRVGSPPQPPSIARRVSVCVCVCVRACACVCVCVRLVPTVALSPPARRRTMAPEGGLVKGGTRRVWLEPLGVAALCDRSLRVLDRAVHAVLEHGTRVGVAAAWRARRHAAAHGVGGAAERDELLVGRLERGAERVLVLGEGGAVLAEGGVGLERQVRRQHHQRLGGVLVLERAVPHARLPLEAHQVGEVRVVEQQRVVGPRAVEARARLRAGQQGAA